MILHTNVMARQQVPFVPWREFESWLLFRSYMVVLESHESLVFDRVYRFVLLAAMMDLDWRVGWIEGNETPCVGGTHSEEHGRGEIAHPA